MNMKQVNILIGRFQPMTKGHLRCMEQAFAKFEVPTVICMIDTPDSKVDERHPFPSSLLLPLYKEIFKRSKLVHDIILVKNADIVKIGAELTNKDCQIRSWTCGTDRIDSYSKMASKYAEQAGLASDFEMLEIKRGDEDESATKARAALLADNKEEFMKLSIPIPLHARLKSDYYSTLQEQLLKVVK